MESLNKGTLEYPYYGSYLIVYGVIYEVVRISDDSPHVCDLCDLLDLCAARNEEMGKSICGEVSDIYYNKVTVESLGSILGSLININEGIFIFKKADDMTLFESRIVNKNIRCGKNSIFKI